MRFKVPCRFWRMMDASMDKKRRLWRIAICSGNFLILSLQILGVPVGWWWSHININPKKDQTIHQYSFFTIIRWCETNSFQNHMEYGNMFGGYAFGSTPFKQKHIITITLFWNAASCTLVPRLSALLWPMWLHQLDAMPRCKPQFTSPFSRGSVIFWFLFKVPSRYLRITSDAFSDFNTGGKPVGAAGAALIGLLLFPVTGTWQSSMGAGVVLFCSHSARTPF